MPSSGDSLTYRTISRTWLPLALSWVVTTAELPLFSTVLARMAEAEINLAAWGVIFSISIIVQAPSTMLLAASTALSRDVNSYTRLRRYMLTIGASLTVLHALIAFTPLYYVVVGGWMAVPAEVLEPARIGLMIMTPWSWGTAYRRFEQGMLIGFGHSRSVTVGALIRMLFDIVILTIGFTLGGIGGVTLAATAVTLGVVAEALFAIWRARSVARTELKVAREREPLTLRAFLEFYVPLAVTILLSLIVLPLVTAALGRMPGALQALAVWPIVFGLLTLWQSVGIAYNEVVIALLDKPGGARALRRFTMIITGVVTGSIVFVLVTPLATLWLERGAGLSGDLLTLAQTGLWVGALLPALRILQSWYQGVLTYSRRTALITESVLVFIVVSGVLLWAGTVTRVVEGLTMGLGAMTIGVLAQTLWLWWRSRPVLAALEARVERPLITDTPAYVRVRNNL